MRWFIKARPPSATGGVGLKNEPGGATTRTGRSCPSFCAIVSRVVIAFVAQKQ
jgi:hypothetical protein